MKQHVTVFGSFAVDLTARVPHLPTPGETVKSSEFVMGPGGKGFNQGIAAKRAGADVTMVTKVGRDTFAEVAFQKLREEDMPADAVLISEEAATGASLIEVDETTGQNQIAMTPGACGTVNGADIERIKPQLRRLGFLLTQLEMNVDAVEKVIALAREYGVRAVLNPAPYQPVSEAVFPMLEVITPNEVEAAALTGVPVKTPDDALKAAGILLQKGVGAVVVTLGSRGALAATKDAYRMFPNYSDVHVVDTTGAGDAFSGGLVAALAEGKGFFDACAFACVVSNLAVTRPGAAAAMPARAEIDEFILNHA